MAWIATVARTNKPRFFRISTENGVDAKVYITREDEQTKSKSFERIGIASSLNTLVFTNIYPGEAVRRRTATAIRAAKKII